jgi:hypothetical protein
LFNCSISVNARLAKYLKLYFCFFVMLQWLLAFLTKRRQVRVFPGQERTAEAQ